MYTSVFITNKEETQYPKVYVFDDQAGIIEYPWKKFNYAYKEDEAGEYISLYENKLKKVQSFDWNDPTGIFESDLPKETRVITDLYLNNDESAKNRILVFDIETDTEGGFAKAELANKEITAIANYDYLTNEYIVFILDKQEQIQDRQIQNKIILSFKTEKELLQNWLNYYHIINPTILSHYNGDRYDIPYIFKRLQIVLGNEAAYSLSPIGIVRYNQFNKKYQIAGVSNLDWYKLYKKFTYSERPSYKLDAIAQEEIGQGKIQYEGSLHNLYKTDIEKFIRYNLNDVELIVGLEAKKKLIDLVISTSHLCHVTYEQYENPSRQIEGAIVTYLHRKGIICSNKPKGSQYNDKDDDLFQGAFVKNPIPGLYEWVVSWDVNSEYPSCIRSINISPETKLGKVFNWEFDKWINNSEDIIQISINKNKQKLSYIELRKLLEENQWTISGNGIIYTIKKRGVIPEILDVWFAERKELKNLMIKYAKEGNKEKEVYYDQMQHIRKILLNSVFGILGLPTGRFFDLDNAEAITLSGQKIVQMTMKYVNNDFNQLGVPPRSEEWINSYWDLMKKDAKQKNKLVPSKPHSYDYCIGGDTDSAHFSLQPVLEAIGYSGKSYDEKKQWCINYARQMEGKLNNFYDVAAKKFFNCDIHYIKIASESLYETGFWLAKKRYAYKKIYDLEKNMDVPGKFVAKGIDVVRSSFPVAFSKFMKTTLNDILNKTDKNIINESILNFIKTLSSLTYLDIAKPTSIKEISKYDTNDTYENITEFIKGTPYHVKAAIAYNRLLTKLGKQDMIEPITDGMKVKVISLKQNPYNLDRIAIKGYDDAPEVIQYVQEYLDQEGMYRQELENKLSDFYIALGWGDLPVLENEMANQFFEF